MDYLQPSIADPNSALTTIYSPRVCWSREYYSRFWEVVKERRGLYGVFKINPEYGAKSRLELISGGATIYSPRVCWSREYYSRFMRPATDEFEPGFGSVFGCPFAQSFCFCITSWT
jgi:hypothetical protein